MEMLGWIFSQERMSKLHVNNSVVSVRLELPARSCVYIKDRGGTHGRTSHQ